MIILFGLAILVLLFTGTREEVVMSDTGVDAECRSDVTAAQDAALEKFCTLQLESLRCPHDVSVTYEAPNGCEISFLKLRGWESVD